MKTTTGWLHRLFRNKDDQRCLACGECCRAFSWHLKVSPRDMERWRELGRKDIIAHVNQKRGWIWYDPDTREPLPICPFLDEVEPGKALCGIHDVKPDICRDYPDLTHGGRCWRGHILEWLVPLFTLPIARKTIKSAERLVAVESEISEYLVGLMGWI